MKIASIPGGPGAEQLPPGIAAGIAGLKPADKLLTMKPDPEFRKTFIPTYTGDSKYGSIMDDYYQSEMFDRDAYFNTPMQYNMASFTNPLFGQMGSTQMGQMGNFNDFLKSNYESMLSQMPSKVVKSQEFMDKFNLYGDAYDKMGFGNPQPTLAPGTSALNPIPQDPGAIQGLLGSGGGAKLPMRPDGSIMQPLPVQGDGIRDLLPAGPMPNTPGVDYDAQANPFHSQSPSQQPAFFPQQPQQPTGGMSSDFANQLLSGIGNLFDKYLSSPSMKQNNLGMGSTNQITPPTPPEQMMTADTQSSMPTSLGSQGMFTPGRGY